MWHFIGLNRYWKSEWVKVGWKKRGLRGQSVRSLCWHPEKFNWFKALPVQGFAMTSSRLLQQPAEGAPFWCRHCFLLSGREFWVLYTNGTGCNRLWDFLFCLLRWLTHALLKNYSETTRRKQIPWVFGKIAWNLLWHFSVFSLPLLLPLPWADAVPFYQGKELHAWVRVHAKKRQPLEVTSALDVESKILLCPLQIISFK